MPRRCCRYCQQAFEPSKVRADQRVCSQPECQRRRRADYHRRKIATDAEYAQVVRDSQRKWRHTHPDFQKTYWQSHPVAADRNRHMQRRRDRHRQAQSLVKNVCITRTPVAFRMGEGEPMPIRRGPSTAESRPSGEATIRRAAGSSARRFARARPETKRTDPLSPIRTTPQSFAAPP